jgi:Lrp/AsnC family transcriptional regulator for asnA, asnC and gidA
MTALDDIDEAIIGHLQRDGRISNREIARALGISETSVRKRLARLQERKVFRLTLVTDVSILGIGPGAYVRLVVSPETCRAVASAIAAMEACGYAALSAGRYNVLCLLTAADEAELSALARDIGSMPGVSDIDMRVIEATQKHRYDLVRIT